MGRPLDGPQCENLLVGGLEQCDRPPRRRVDLSVRVELAAAIRPKFDGGPTGEKRSSASWSNGGGTGVNTRAVS